MIIKKHKNQNQYVLTKDGIWVRNLCLDSVPCVDINNLISQEEFSIFLDNELENYKKQYPAFETERIRMPKILILSCGCGFEEKKKIISTLPKDVVIFGVNGVLNKWSASDGKISYYIVNNPYKECLSFIPKNKYYPRCIASIRTNPLFLKDYKNRIFSYIPVPEVNFSDIKFNHAKMIDDYRNVVCAAMGLAYNFGVSKLMLLCCDDSFPENRPGSVPLDNGLFCYPQQIISNNLIDYSAFWLKNKEIKVAFNGSGPKLEHATYIKEEDIIGFFEDGQ